MLKIFMNDKILLLLIQSFKTSEFLLNVYYFKV